MTTIRICFVGDSLVLGTNDETYLGWPGRLCRDGRAAGHDMSLYNLGIRAETSEQIAPRWRAECKARIWDTHPGALVFSFGANDCAEIIGEGRRVSLEDSKEIARTMMAQARDWLPTLWIGPPPVDDSRQPFQVNADLAYHFASERMAELNAAYTEIAADLGIPYLDMYTRLVDDPAWPGMYEDADGVHPIAAGYEVMAEHIADWAAWQAWFE
ncbi:MAG: lipase [Rhodospirillaceae bacterium]|nr:lipase [Rhodospirillaceae bacterium]